MSSIIVKKGKITSGPNLANGAVGLYEIGDSGKDEYPDWVGVSLSSGPGVRYCRLNKAATKYVRTAKLATYKDTKTPLTSTLANVQFNFIEF